MLLMKFRIPANELNLNLPATGDSAIDTGDNLILGRFVGENEDHYAITVDFIYRLSPIAV